MTFEDSPLRYFSPKVIRSPRLTGLIYEIAKVGGLDHVTSLGRRTLQQAIEQPSLESIKVEFTKQGNGWRLSNLETRRYSAGVPTTRLPSGS